jgi:hypothetical protein
VIDVVHIVERLTTGPSDVIAPVGVTSSWRYRIIAPVGVTSSWCRIICDVMAELWVLNFWIKFATVRAKKGLKMLSLVSCDKQKMALVCFLSGNITLMVFLAGKPTRPLKKHTRAVFLLDHALFHNSDLSPQCHPKRKNIP